ncbi:unnamed protein product [Urochloa humidicola]
MAPPPWVLLNRKVNFVDGRFAGGAGKAAAAIGGSSGERSVEESLAAMEPHPIVAAPPEVTTLSMVRLIPADELRRVDGGMISSTDKGLVVLYAGMYRPGNGAYSPAGCYLVYDASSNSLSAIPQLDPPTSRCKRARLPAPAGHPRQPAWSFDYSCGAPSASVSGAAISCRALYEQTKQPAGACRSPLIRNNQFKISSLLLAIEDDGHV